MQLPQNKHILASVPIYGSLLGVFSLVLLTLSNALMGWVWVLCGCAIVIGFLRLKRNLPSVKNVTLNLLAIFCMVLLIYLSGDFGLMATMVNLLVVAGCLKLINLQSRADYHLVLIVLFFLIACGFIYHQSIYFVIYYFICISMLLITAFLLNKGSLSIVLSIKQSAKMITQALPIALVLFVVVPRLPPFWQTNVESNTQTGLSEQITPGDIADLAQSDELVFRAEFDQIVPQPQDRYWRSIVLDYFDGKSWMMARQHTEYDRAKPIQLSGESVRYLIIAEPNTTRWLYSLDIPTIEENMSGISINMNRQYQFYKNEISTNPSLYITRSFIDARLNIFVPELDFVRYLQVPISGNPRTQNWVQENLTPNMSFHEKISKTNAYFTDNAFSYTLKPPLMQTNPVDAFLFDNQLGFCSHYASAFAYMLRLANIPTRLVAGYQGGEVQGENILSVRQFDAHAWVEAYHPEQGWLRFDPTALIAPNRTLSGLISALNEQESRLFNEDIGSLFDIPALNVLREQFTILDHNWNQVFLGFNNNSQTDLIKALFGEFSRKSLMHFLLATIAIIIMFLAMIFLPYRKWFYVKRKSSLQKVLARLEKKGFVRRKQESLRQFFERIKAELSEETAHALENYVQSYYQAMYETPESAQDIDLQAHAEFVVHLKKVS
jgi:transglutaminase-like putative cysteine protease